MNKTPEGISVGLQNNTKDATLFIQVIDDFGIVEEESFLALVQNKPMQICLLKINSMGEGTLSMLH